MTQFGQPISDITMDWSLSSGSNGWELVDGTTFEDTGRLSSSQSAEVAEVTRTSLTDPAVSTVHIIRIRMQAVNGGGAGERLDFELRQGASTQIALMNNQNANRGSFQTETLTLSAGEADSITD